VSNQKIEYILAWRFIASQNDDEIYAYGTDSQAKQFCSWLNHERTSDRYTYSEVAVSETRSIGHIVFSLKEAINSHILSPSNDEFLSKSIESREVIANTAYPPFLDKNQTEAKIILAVGAIIEWNRRHPNKFAITPSLLKRTTGLSTTTIHNTLINHQQMIDMHHTSLGWNCDWPPANGGYDKKKFEALADFIQSVL
jgi:hypothetical protein